LSVVSVITAIAIIADVSRFRNSKLLASYLLSALRVENSNDKTIIKSTNKARRKLSITLLSQSLNHFHDNNKDLSIFYEKVSLYMKEGINRMVLCRKVITQIYQMLKKQDYHYSWNSVLHEKKMSEYIRFLNKENIFFQESLKAA